MIKKIGFAVSLFLAIAPMASAAHITKECLDPFNQELRYGDGTRLRRPEMASEVQKLQRVLNWDEDSKMWVRSRPAGSVGYPGYEGNEYLARTAAAVRDFNKKWGILPTRTQERTGRIVATSTRDRLNQIIAAVCDSTTQLTMSDPVVSNVTQTSARISFTTTVSTQAYVLYGPGLSMSASSSVALGTEHQVSLGNLLPGTTYNYKAVAWRPSGVVYSPESAFATLPATPATTTVNLTVAKSGTGTGTIRGSSYPGIDCGSTCTASYASGTITYLFASPSTGSAFTGWSGCDFVATSTCEVRVSTNRTISAFFALSTSTATTTAQSAQTAYLASALQALAEAVERLRQLVFYGSH